MPEIKVTQTYNIDVARNITLVGRNYTFRHEDYWFTGHFEKAEANDITVKMYDDGTAQALVKATAYLTIVLNTVGTMIVATVKALFTIKLDKVKISDLKGPFISEPGSVSNLDLDIDFNPDVARNAQESIANNLANVINRKRYELDIEQTASKIEYIEK